MGAIRGGREVSYEQKRLTVRVFLPGPPEKVVDWEAVASDVFLYKVTDGNWWKEIVAKHTTERPSRVDTGVDVVIENDPDTGTAEAYFNGNRATLVTFGPSRETLAALGFPTEPQAVTVLKAEGEVRP
jgi:hypothetical protein